MSSIVVIDLLSPSGCSYIEQRQVPKRDNKLLCPSMMATAILVVCTSIGTSSPGNRVTLWHRVTTTDPVCDPVY